MSACTGQARGNTCRAPAEARDAEPRALPLLTLAAWVHHRATLLLEFAAAFSSAPGFAAPLPLLPLPLPLPLLMQCLGSTTCLTTLPYQLFLPTGLTKASGLQHTTRGHCCYCSIECGGGGRVPSADRSRYGAYGDGRLHCVRLSAQSNRFHCFAARVLCQACGHEERLARSAAWRLLLEVSAPRGISLGSSDRMKSVFVNAARPPMEAMLHLSALGRSQFSSAVGVRMTALHNDRADGTRL